MKHTLTSAGALRRLATLTFAATLTACGPAEKPREGVLQPAVEKDAVIYPAASPQIASLASVPVEARREVTLRFNGRLAWDEDRTARIFAPLGGRVLGIAVRPGDRVKAGQTLVTLAAAELGAAQAEARKAEQDQGFALKSLARVEELHGAGVAPEKDLQAARAEAERSATERARTTARLALYGGSATAIDQRYALRTPVAGVVVERNLNPGQELRPETMPQGGLLVVSDPSHLWFSLDVAEADVGNLRPGVEVELASTGLGTATVRARVTHVADLVDPQTRAVKVRGTVANPQRLLKAEMFVTATLRIPTTTGLLVPARAVYLRGEQYFAFVDAGNGRFERRALKIGPAENGHQVVLQGLRAGDKVVVEGTLFLERMLASKD